MTWRRDQVEVFLAASKTDRAGRGTTIRLFASGTPGMCAVSLLRDAWQGAPVQAPDAPLLQVDSHGSALPYAALLGFIKQGTAQLGLDPACFGAHSLRIGGATQLAAADFTDTQIQAAGRWSSDCFQRYVRLGDTFFQHVATSLARGSPASALAPPHHRPDWSQSRAPSHGGPHTPFMPRSLRPFTFPSV
jgi:hypothetical protein